MSVRYRDQHGHEVVCSGLTPGGDISFGAVTTRTGVISLASLAAGETNKVDVVFEDPMPDADYTADFSIIRSTNDAINVMMMDPTNKTKNGFRVRITNLSSSTDSDIQIKYYAYKLYDVAEAELLYSSVQDIQSYLPSNVSSTNKLSTKSDLQAVNRSLDMRLDDIEDVIPLDASVSNQLATQSQVQEAMANAGLKVTDSIPSAPQDEDVILYVGNESGLKKGGIYQYSSSAGAWVLISTAEVDLSHYETTFVGTTAEWNALTTAEKNQYTLVSLTDDQEALGVNAVDAVADSDMHPITSNAVYDCFKGLFKIATASLTAYSGITAAGKYLVPLEFTVPTGYVPVAVVRWDFGRIKGLNIMGLLLGPTLTTVQMTCYADNALDTVLNGSVEVLCIKSEFKPS